jgi:hypothetical protein
MLRTSVSKTARTAAAPGSDEVRAGVDAAPVVAVPVRRERVRGADPSCAAGVCSCVVTVGAGVGCVRGDGRATGRRGVAAFVFCACADNGSESAQVKTDATSNLLIIRSTSQEQFTK